jgi:putative ATP-dependent endonuclease of OLD family
MYIESIKLKNFRCFGPETIKIGLQQDLTAFVGTNGSGKTAVMQALMRMFGVTTEYRKVSLQDFHVPVNEGESPIARSLHVEVILAFPELANPAAENITAVPSFFQQMASDDNGQLKVRLRLNSTWTDDGSISGEVETELVAITTFSEEYSEDQVHRLRPSDRARIQFIYIPAVRSASAQVTSFLRGRLWRAISWSEGMQGVLEESGAALNAAFSGEDAITKISGIVKKRWNEVHTAGTDTTPIFQPVDLRFQSFVQKVEVAFFPDENGRERSMEDLSDGQNSLFHIAMSTATLDLETEILSNDVNGFQTKGIPLPSLTILALEEPENNLSPFYLSRIIGQVKDVTQGLNAQALISSHSASILARVEPEQIRHYRLENITRSSVVSSITLPASEDEAGKYLREAIHAYPELYFAKFVILGEGASEELILPRIAAALGVEIDRSFVSIVPLGGRHVNHMWRLLNDLNIPHATLLDLDLGRHGGGWGRIKYVCKELMAIGGSQAQVAGRVIFPSDADFIASFDNGILNQAGLDTLQGWVSQLKTHGVYFSNPLDIDWSMIKKFTDEYQELDDGMSGPSDQGDPKNVVLGEEGDPQIYEPEDNDTFKWYRYLFLGRGKPTTHIRILGKLDNEKIAENAPIELKELIGTMRSHINSGEQPETDV